MRRTLWVVLLCLGSTACDPGRGLHRRRDPGTLVVARATDVQLLDPARALDSESIEIGTQLFEGLVRWTAGTTQIEPGLARSWQTSADGKVWTFELRPGVVFHDGTPVDAAAVVFSFERLLVPKHPSYLASEDANYWRSLIKDVSRVTALDADTVEIRLERPYAPLLGYLALFPIVSPAAVTRWGDAFKEHPVGAGPFAFEEWRPGDTLVLRRFARYYGKPAPMERIVFRIIVDPRQRLVELEAGTVDLAMAILPDEQSFVELHPELELHSTQSNDVSYLAFNLQRKPFTSRAVRRAFAHAVNKVPIVKLAFQGRAHAAEGPLPPKQWGHHVPKMRYPFDPDRARELLHEAAEQHLIDPDAIYTLYAPSQPRPYMTSPERIARYLQAAFRNVGVKVEIRLQPYQPHRDSVQAAQHDLALFGWIGDTGDPDNFLYVLFHSKNAELKSAHNISFLRDAEIDRLLMEARAVTDQSKREQIYRTVQDRIAEEVPWVPIAHSEYVVAARKELTNVILSPLGHPVYAGIARARSR